MKHTNRIFAAVVSAGLASTAVVGGALTASATTHSVTGSGTAAPKGAGVVSPTTVYGPRGAPACTGVAINVGQEAQTVVAGYPAGTTFCFSAGLHRVTKTIQPKAGMTLGSSAGAVLTGSVQLSSWTATGGDWVTRGVLPAAYSQTAPCEDNVANVCNLREQLFDNGVHLKRVTSRDAVVPGTFYGDYTANEVYVGTDPAAHRMEMSRTATAIASNVTGVTVRGLTVEHFASAAQAGAVLVGPGWSVYSNDVRHNHGVGVMMIHADEAVLSKNLIHHNGQLGVGQYSTVNGRITSNYVLANNTDGFWIADWESGGIKTTWSNGGSVSDNLIRLNLGVGLWADAYDENRLFSGNTIDANAADGIRFEISRNGVISNNVISNNGFGTRRGSGTSLWDGAGVNINTSSNVKVQGNQISANVNGVSIQSRTRGSGPWGVNVLRGVVVSGNTITMTAGTQTTGMVQNVTTPLPAGEGVYESNTYRLDSLTANRFQRFGKWYTAATWKSAGQDAGSTYTVA